MKKVFFTYFLSLIFHISSTSVSNIKQFSICKLPRLAIAESIYRKRRNSLKSKYFKIHMNTSYKCGMHLNKIHAWVHIPSTPVILKILEHVTITFPMGLASFQPQWHRTLEPNTNCATLACLGNFEWKNQTQIEITQGFIDTIELINLPTSLHQWLSNYLESWEPRTQYFLLDRNQLEQFGYSLQKKMQTRRFLDSRIQVRCNGFWDQSSMHFLLLLKYLKQ